MMLASTLALFSLLVCSATATVYVSPDGDNANPGTQSSPFLQIQYALDNSANGELIVLLNGSYPAEGNSNLNVAAGREVTIRGPDAIGSVPLATIALSKNVFLRSNSLGATLSVYGIMFLGGSKVFDLTSSISSKFIMTNCVVLDSSDDTTAGGAVSLSYLAGGTVLMTNVSFSNNYAYYADANQGSGGALYIYSEAPVTVTLQDCSFFNNQAIHNGGAIFLNVSSQSIFTMNCDNIDQSTVKANVAGISGGALYISGSQSSTAVESTSVFISTCRFAYNNASAFGGAVALFDTLSTVMDGYFLENALNKQQPYTDSCGGAIFVNGGVLTVESSELRNTSTFFIANSAWNQGGAVCLRDTSDYNLFRDTTWFANIAYKLGSHVYVGSEGGSSVFQRNSFSCSADSCNGKRYDIAAGKSATLEFSDLALTDNTITVIDSLYLDVDSSMTITSYANTDPSTRVLKIGGEFYMAKDSYFLTNGPLTIANSCEFESNGGILESGGKGTALILSIYGQMNLYTQHALETGGPTTLIDFDLISRSHSGFTTTPGVTLFTDANVYIEVNGTWSLTDNFTLSSSNPSLTFQNDGIFYAYHANISHSVTFSPTSSVNIHKLDDSLIPPLVVSNGACLQGDLQIFFPSAPSPGYTYGIIGYTKLNCDSRFKNITLRDFDTTVYSYYGSDLFSIRTTALKENGGLGGGAIAGIVITLFIVVLGVTVVAYYYWYNNRASEDDDEATDQFVSPSDRVSSSYGSTSL